MDLGDFQLFRLALHELRTPLTSVQLNAQLIERSLVKLGLENECRLAGTIVSAARKLDELTQELGDVFRLCSGKIALDLRTHDLSLILPEILSRHGGTTQAHRVHTMVPDHPLPITVDARRLDRVVGNLILIGQRLDVLGIGIDLRASASLAEVEISVSVPAGPAEAALAPPGDDELGLGFLVSRILVECHGGKLEAQRGPAREVVLRCVLPRR